MGELPGEPIYGSLLFSQRRFSSLNGLNSLAYFPNKITWKAIPDSEAELKRSSYSNGSSSCMDVLPRVARLF